LANNTASQDEDAAKNVISLLLIFLIALSFGIISISLFIAIVVNKSIITALTEVTLVAEKISKEDYSVGISEQHKTRRDEIGQLARSFSYMAGSLQERGRDLLSEIEARKQLERRVLEVSDEEQQRIGQDIHDGLTQHLLGISLSCRSLENRIKENIPKFAPMVTRVGSLLDEAVSDDSFAFHRFVPRACCDKRVSGSVGGLINKNSRRVRDSM